MHVEITEPLRDLHVLHHRATEHANLAVELLRHVEARFAGGESKKRKRRRRCALRLSKNLLKGRNDSALRRRAPGHGGVRRIGGEREHALLPVAAKSTQVNRLADDGRLVNLVVTRVDDRADRRVIASEKQSISECETRMNSTSKLADLDRLSRLDAMQQDVVQQVVLFEFAFGETHREVRGVNGHVEFFRGCREARRDGLRARA